MLMRFFNVRRVFSLFIIIPMLPFTGFETIIFRLNIYVSGCYLHARAGSVLLPAMALVFIYLLIIILYPTLYFIDIILLLPFPKVILN